MPTNLGESWEEAEEEMIKVQYAWKIQEALMNIMECDHLSSHRVGLAQQRKHRERACKLLREIIELNEEQAEKLHAIFRRDE